MSEQFARIIEAIKQVTSDPVNHPPHYTAHPSGIECIQVTEHHNFCVGNAIKYLWRAGLKGDGDAAKHAEDLRKAIWYLQRELKRVEKLSEAAKTTSTDNEHDSQTNPR